MKKILELIAHHAETRPDHIALNDGTGELSYSELRLEIERVASALYSRRVGLLMANGLAWAVMDLAILRYGATSIPLPPFFSDAQLRHLIDDAGLELIITDQPSRVRGLMKSTFEIEITIAGQKLNCLALPTEQRTAPTSHPAKITYTSGTTGRPKGVRLSGEAIERVALSLNTAVDAAAHDRALSLLPLSTLLANIGGIYAPLCCGATAYLPDLADCGMSGSSGVVPYRLVEALNRFQPTVTILVPQLLKVLVEAAEQGARLPASLRFIAVGGAPVAPKLLSRARKLGLPVYQGYGLSEAASVVSLNLPGDDRGDSVGRPLPHVQVRIADDGEIMVSGNLCDGYLGRESGDEGEWPTGDIGHLDHHGYLYVTGRKKTAFATAYGRKLSPEWIESELIAVPCIAQAALFGENRDFNVAVIVPSSAKAVLEIGATIAALNESLPDYARVSRWIIAHQPFSTGNSQITAGGSPDRKAIAASYAKQLNEIYSREQSHAIL